MEKETIFKSFRLLKHEYSMINKRGKPSGKKRVMLNKFGLSVGPEGRELVRDQILHVFENLLSDGFHFVLQASEGDGIKIVDQQGYARCVALIRKQCLQTYNMKADRKIAQEKIKECGLFLGNDGVCIRENSKSKYVYTDFSDGIDPDKISLFIKSLPPSYPCFCGREINSGKNFILGLRPGDRDKRAKERNAA